VSRFRHFVAIDWSGASGERHKGLAVAVADAAGGPPVLARHHWSRGDILAVLRDLPPATLAGLDLGLSLPFADCGAFFPGWDYSPPDARSLWALVERLSVNDPHLGSQGFVDHPEASRYFRRHGGREGAAFRCDDAAHGRGRFRVTELEQGRMGCKPYSNFNLVGAAQVGKSSLTGMRVLHALSGTVPIWPIDPLPPSGPVVVEIYTTLAAMAAGRSAGRAKMRSVEALNEALAALGSPPVAGEGEIDDHASDALLAAAWLRDVADRPELWAPARMSTEIARTEGWTFGVP
jgi:hypothetical protein